MVSHQPGVDLASRLEPDDKMLEVVRLTFGDGSGPPQGMSRMQVLAQRAAFVAIVETESVDSRLTPLRDWVDSFVAFRVVNAFKDARSERHKGDTVLVYPGGDVILDKRVIRAKKAGAYPIRSRVRYLVFGFESNDRLEVDPNNIYEIAGEHLRPLSLERKEAELTLASALREISEAVRQ